MNTKSSSDQRSGGQVVRSSRIRRALVAVVGAVAMTSGAVAFAGAPAFAATPVPVGVHTEHFECAPWQYGIGCPYPPADVLLSSQATASPTTAVSSGVNHSAVAGTVHFSAPMCYYVPAEPYCGN